MNAQKAWSIAGLFVICLVVSMPFYSASSLAASVSITRNEGEAGIEGFIDAQGDTWEVDATITGALETSIDPERVRIKIGETVEQPFQSCSSSDLGVVCNYVSPLPNPVAETSVPFIVEYDFIDALQVITTTASAPAVINADGSEPEFDFSLGDVEQQADGSIEIDFTVTDKILVSAPAVGLEKIEITDAGNGDVLQTIDASNTANFELGDESFNYATDSGFGEKLQATFTGEGQRAIKIKAIDRLGHEGFSNAVTFDTDFVAPTASELNVTKLGKFVSDATVVSDVTMVVVESGNLALGTVVASSSDIPNINDKVAECVDISFSGQDREWLCTWKNVEVPPKSSLSVSVTMTDAFSNSKTQTLSASFVQDSIAPSIEFFGTERVFEGESFVKNGENTIVARIKEENSGLVEEDVLANLAGVGGGNGVTPDECELVDGLFECRWLVNKNSYGVEDGSAIDISLVSVKDAVGNEITKAGQVIVDNTAPEIEEIEAFGVSQTAGYKAFFQSQDKLVLEMKVIEDNGLMFLLDARDIINDAEITFPETVFADAGWMIFTEDNCEVEGTDIWTCALETDSMKSGFDSTVGFSLIALDTAGNPASVWPEEEPQLKNIEFEGISDDEAAFSFELLAVEDEAEPDYWEVDPPIEYLGFVDLDTAQLIPPRVAMEVELESDKAIARQMEAVDCVPAEGAPNLGVSRVLLYGGSSDAQGSVTPTLVVELDPFNPEEVFGVSLSAESEEEGVVSDPEEFEDLYVPFTCSLRIYSQVGESAIKNAELQEVEVTIPFGLTDLGALDTTVQDKIKEAREDGFTEFAEVMAAMGNVLQWIDFIVNLVIVPLVGIIEIITAVEIAMAPASKTGFATAITGGACAGTSTVETSLGDVLDFLQVPIQILSCNPEGFGEIYGPLGQWQQSVLDYYNAIATGGFAELEGTEAAFGMKGARTLRDNIIVSTIGLCIPGIIYNLEKLGQAQCQYIYCLENEALNGVPVDVCEQLRKQVICKYVFGELFGFIPFFSSFNLVADGLKAFISDWIGTAASIAWNLCKSACGAGPEVSGLCDVTTFVIKLFQIITGVIGSLQSHEAIEYDWCARVNLGKL